MPTVEGFTPTVLWTSLYGFFAICLLFLIGYKVYEAIHTLVERRRQRKEAEQPDFADKVSKKVITELAPRFEDIEKKLARDNMRLDDHERMINDIKGSHKEIHDGLSAICKFMLVISTYGNIGNDEKVKEASAELQKFLAEKL